MRRIGDAYSTQMHAARTHDSRTSPFLRSARKTNPARQSTVLSLKARHSVMHHKTSSQIVLLESGPSRTSTPLIPPAWPLVRNAARPLACRLSSPPLAVAAHCTRHPCLASQYQPAALGLPRLLDGKLSRPLPRRRLVSSAVGLVHVSNLWDERVVGVGVSEHGADGEQDCFTRQQFVLHTRLARPYLSILSVPDSTGLAECPDRCCRWN